jgi:UDP-N-acetylglucosamine transferase subunit ALG13
VILVTLGNHRQPFNRLLKKIDQLVEEKVIESVFAQIGYTDYKPKYYKFQKFVGFNTFLRLIEKSTFVISHAGAGTIMNILSCNKPAVIMPRLNKYGEHTNNHQVEITQALEKEGKIIPVYDIENLKTAVIKARNFIAEKQNNTSSIKDIMREQIERWF